MQIPRDYRQEFANGLPSRGNVEDGRISRLGDRLSQSLRPAVTPAVNLSDAVHISPEARAASSSAAFSPDLPTPAEVTAALVAIAHGSEPMTQAVGQLASLLQQLARQLPATAPAAPSTDTASVLIRALFWQQGSPKLDLESVAQLVRALLTESGATGTLVLSNRVLERAAAQILLSVVRWRTDGGKLTAASGFQQESLELPPALYSLIGGTPERRQRRQPKPQPARKKMRPKDDDPAPEQSPYRSSPRRT